jgi:hypothetical protein
MTLTNLTRQEHWVMHPSFSEAFLRDNRRELDRSVRGAYLRREGGAGLFSPLEAVALRLNRVHDDDALENLGRLEGRRVTDGCYVVAEVGGRIVAALPLGGGAPLADPFRPTAHLLPLLELRARQLTDYRPRLRTRALRLAVRAFGRA